MGAGFLNLVGCGPPSPGGTGAPPPLVGCGPPHLHIRHIGEGAPPLLFSAAPIHDGARACDGVGLGAVPAD